MKIREKPIRGFLNRLFQLWARILPGGRGWRIRLHRLRGVIIGEDVFIGTDVILETARPDLVRIGDRVALGTRCTLLAHFDGDIYAESHIGDVPLVLESDVFIGPGAIVLPRVKIGKGSVVTAGSVVTRSIPPNCMVQGNPAKIIARCDRSLSPTTSTWDFVRHLKKSDKDNVT